jgi:hypothetical protein
MDILKPTTAFLGTMCVGTNSNTWSETDNPDKHENVSPSGASDDPLAVELRGARPSDQYGEPSGEAPVVSRDGGGKSAPRNTVAFFVANKAFSVITRPCVNGRPKWCVSSH